MKIGVLQTRSTNMPYKDKEKRKSKAVSILHCCNFLTMLFYYDALRCVDTNFTEGGLCEESHERGAAPAQAGQHQRMEKGAVCFVCACFFDLSYNNCDRR